MLQRIYLITGILGHLGSTVARELLKQGATIRGFDLKQVVHNDLQKEKVNMFYGDIRNLKEVEPLFQDLEDYEVIVIHCAGIVSISSHYDERVYSVNVNGTKNIVNLCKKYAVKKLVHISSVHAIPEGEKGSLIKEVSSFHPDAVTGLYAKTKAIASQYVLDATKEGLDASIIHPSGIIGPYDLGNGHLTSMIIDFLNHNLTALVKGGYDFVDVRDVTNTILACTEKGRKGECYIVTNHYFTVQEIINIVANLSNKKMIKTVLPLWFARLTAPLSEVYYKIRKMPPLYTSYSLYTLQSNSNFSHEKATKELGYKPRPIEETLKDTIIYLGKNNLVKGI